MPWERLHRKLLSLLETIDYWAAALFLFEQTPRLPEAIVIPLPVTGKSCGAWRSPGLGLRRGFSGSVGGTNSAFFSRA